MPQKDTLDDVAYTSYPIIVTHLSFNFLCLLLLYSIYLNGLITVEALLDYGVHRVPQHPQKLPFPGTPSSPNAHSDDHNTKSS